MRTRDVTISGKDKMDAIIISVVILYYDKVVRNDSLESGEKSKIKSLEQLTSMFS